MKPDRQIWVIEAHDLGALQIRPITDAIKINRKKWLAGEKADPASLKELRRADRMIVGCGESIEEALEEERELKRMRGGQTHPGPAVPDHPSEGGDLRT